MANDALIADLQRMRQEVVQSRGAGLNRIDTLNFELETAKDELRVATEQEQKAAFNDDEKRAEVKRLIDHVNGLPNQPQVFLERIGKLESELLETSKLRNAFGSTTRARQKQVDNAKTNVTLAEIDLKAIEKNLAEIDEQLRQIRGY